MSRPLPAPAPTGDPLSFAAALVEAPPRWVPRMVSLAICALVLGAVAYASLCSVDVVVSLPGRVISAGKSKVVQPLEAGTVRTIAARDGQSVKAGDVLIELDSTSAAADRERLARELWESRAAMARASALLEGRDRLAMQPGMPAQVHAHEGAVLAALMLEGAARLAALDAEVARRQSDRDAVAGTRAKLEAGLPLVQRKHELRDELARAGYLAPTGLIDTELELANVRHDALVTTERLREAEAALAEVRHRRQQAVAEFRLRAATERAEAGRRAEALRQELLKAEQRERQQVLRAPIDGIVQQLAVTTLGGVVTPAQALLTVVPDGTALEVEAQVLNRDVGQLRVGQRVVNKIEAFDYTRWGGLGGEVAWIAQDAVADPTLGPVYPVRIRLDASQLPQRVGDRTGRLSAGMNVTTDVQVGQRRLIDYFLAPLLRARQEGLREP
ncbi:HlyD family type I secretion periplasmic adaptor subunit [Ramlibacter sp. AW1]|uniref:Membrane fusion protein (MFP) family protein n=1 Tax=Ramlibacter aurantiacus TaxID=2801330 RepID=A0A936ZML7_9BURK|nr:HlyD family type I secretion periplasmic adaptor subunit [Ramlibacter aurantiacus]MBL0420466.1 HlyD family type I secretion periplasmic adaptor subunit [Ramlibacter aurantiacus]